MTRDADCVSAYLELKRLRGDLFDRPGVNGAGAIELVHDEADFPVVQEAVRSSRLARGLKSHDTRIGVLADDPFVTFVRDPVVFPDGSFGLYNRIVEGRPVAALAMLHGRIVLLRIFRHGMRRWSLEFPRGGCDGAETPEAAVRRELAEEIGGVVEELVDLGEFTPGGATLGSIGRLFFARLSSIGRPSWAESIERVMHVTPAEMDALVTSAEIIDGFTLSTFVRARLAGLA